MWIKWSFFFRVLRRKINSKSLEIFDAYFTRTRAESRIEKKPKSSINFGFFSLSLCFLLVVSKSLNGSPAEQREKER